MTSFSSASSNITQAFTSFFLTIVHSFLGIAQAVFALVQNTVLGVWRLGAALVNVAVDLLQGVVGFVTGARSPIFISFLSKS